MHYYKPLLMLASLSATALACTKVHDVTETFYGYPDNDPPGAAIAYDCGRGNKAGGIGTYDDPLTFASAPGEFTKCEVIYNPYLRKYLRFEDTCAQCIADWRASPRVHHIDVWTGSSGENGGQEQIRCEDSLTPQSRSQSIVRGPRNNLPVDKTHLYVKGSGHACRTNHVYKSYNVNDYC